MSRAVFALNLLACGASAADLKPELSYNRDIRPILSENCFACHGPDQSHRKAKLRMDLREEAIEKGAIEPGKPTESEMILRIFSQDADEQMPPPDSHKTLTPAQRETLKRWVEQGAAYQQHWSFEKVVRPATPPAQNAIDFLVQQRLATAGLRPAPEADRRTLIRRLYSDLLGLPPSPEDVAAFVNDAAPDAYARLVERLLANPHYGERMALGWLDVVRFADSRGYHSDKGRNVWPYRDWVIKSFNDNKRFDRFTIEQLAGDLLPDANDETRVGSAFNRLLLSTDEGGAQAKDYEARMLTDRVRAVGTVWLGLTTGCAQCHDHKFDPFSTRDFYSLGAFFADIKEPIIGQLEDGMLVPTPEQAKALAQAEAQLATAKAKFDKIAPQLAAAQQQWEEDVKLYSITLPPAPPPQDDANGEVKETRPDINKVLKKDPAKRSTKEKQAVQDYFRFVVTKQFNSEIQKLTQAEMARRHAFDPIPKCLVSISTPQKRTVRILPRGNWMNETGEIVQPALPHAFAQSKIEGREPTRLDLAQWLISRENPLTARTVMNRMWKQFFGLGLSKVLDDLGAQGEMPPNGALLDWLAAEFMESGWDTKHMVRTIVNSATYRQISEAPKELLAMDPENRFLARQGRFRVDAELVRDNALAVSGLLTPTIGGPSVKPYQPEGYWENLNFPVRKYIPDLGAAQYRRGLYTWWQRTFTHPAMLAFDAPSREECTAERSRSNIPQQALVLLNDPSFVETAKALATRILTEAPGKTADERLGWAWQQVLQRAPTVEESSTVRALYEQQLEQCRQWNAVTKAAFEKDGLANIHSTADSEELAAWTHVARVLLNLHETITRS